MTGYDTCDCDNYNPDCRCHPRQEADTMTKPERTDTTPERDPVETIRERIALIRNNQPEVPMWGERYFRAPVSYVEDIEEATDALAARLAAAEAERDAEWARAERLRVAVRKAADRELSRVVTDEVNRREGDMPSREWVSLRKGTIESNIYANDGLEFGDMDGSDDLLSRAAVIADVLEGNDDA